MPTSDFFYRLLHYYQIELHNLDPNSILQISSFVALNEGYLGIKPNFALWKHFFFASVFSKTLKIGGTTPVHAGSCLLQIRQSRMSQYIPMKGSSSHKGWHLKWFYLRSDPDAPLPRYSGRFFREAPEYWNWGPEKAERKKISTLLQVV